MSGQFFVNLRHKRIERFGIQFIVLFLCLLAIVLKIAFSSVAEDAVVNTWTPLFTRTSTMSLSGTTLEFLNVFGNEAQTKAFVVIKADSLDKLAGDALMYQLIVRTENQKGEQEVPLSNPKFTFYMMGNTGYLGLLLEDKNGFPSQIYHAILRNNRRGFDAAENVAADGHGSQLHDQAQFYFNPGASETEKVDWLEGDSNPTFRDVYATLYTGEQEAEAKAVLKEDVEQLDNGLLQIQEYQNRLQRADIVVPALPAEVDGDEVIAFIDGQKLERTARLNYVYPEGHERAGQVVDPEDLTKEFVTDYIYPGGYDLDWQNRSILDGFLDSLTNGQDAKVYLEEQEALRTESTAVIDELENYEWKYTNGKEFKYDAKRDSAAVQQIDSDISSYIDAISEYLEVKKAYQTEHMDTLLQHEIELKDTEELFTTSSDPAQFALLGTEQ